MIKYNIFINNNKFEMSINEIINHIKINKEKIL